MTDREVDDKELEIEFEPVPDIREFVQWATCEQNGVWFLPRYEIAGYLVPTRAAVGHRRSKSPGLVDVWHELEEWRRPTTPPYKYVTLFEGFTTFDHGTGATRGGMWVWDLDGEGWMAPSFSHLIDVCLEYAERDWLALDEHGEIALSNKARVDAEAKEVEYYAQNPDAPEYLEIYGRHVSALRLAAYDNPSLITPFRRDWIW